MSSTTNDFSSLAAPGWVSFPNWLEASESLSLLSFAKRAKAENRFKRAAIGRAEAKLLDDDVRRDEILWLESSAAPEIAKLFEKLETLKTTLNREFFLGLHDFEAHLAFYPPGGFYERHRDRFRDDDSRTISAVLYLNENWEPGHGGELEIFDERGAHEIEPRLGNLVLFQSATVEHRVLESRQDRWSVAIWFRRQKPAGSGL